MKRIFSFLMLFALLCGTLAGCAPAEPPEEVTPEPDPAETLTPEHEQALRQLADPRGTIPFDQSDFTNVYLETSYGVYCVSPLAPGAWDNFLQVMPRELDHFVPLCAKPNCMHCDGRCGAWLTCPRIGYCNDRLYIIDSAQTDRDWLVSMNLDGTGRRKEVVIPSMSSSAGGEYYPDYIFHGSKLILVYAPDSRLSLMEQIPVVRILDINTREITEPFADQLTSNMRLGYAIRPAGSVIYADCYFRDSHGALECWIVAMDMDTGEVRKLFAMDMFYEYTVDGNTIYYLVPGVGAMEYDLTTGETVNRGLPVPDAFSNKVDGDLIYVFGGDYSGMEIKNQVLYILDRDYNILDQISVDGLQSIYNDQDRITFGKGTVVTCFLDKSKIGTGTLELEPLN